METRARDRCHALSQEQTKVARLDSVQQGTAVKLVGAVPFSRRNTKENFPQDVSIVLFHVPLLFCHPYSARAQIRF